MRRNSTTSRSLATARVGLVMVSLLLATGSMVCAASKSRGKTRSSGYVPRGGVMHGKASWYGPGFHGRRTASGERFNRYAPTLASRSLPFGTRVRVTNLKNGKTALGRVNDRGPFVRGRIIDLSQGLAGQLGISGVGNVRVEVLGKKPPPPPPARRRAAEPRAEASPSANQAK